MNSLGLCQPSSAVLLVSVAGALYNLLAGHMHSVAWWAMVGIFGTGVFQGLCYGGLEPIAWILMSIPVLIVCFFMAVALFASRMRIENVVTVPCGRCGHRPCDCRSRCSCGGSGCPICQTANTATSTGIPTNAPPVVENYETQPIAASATMTGCPQCEGRGCPYCAFTKDSWAALQKTKEGFHPGTEVNDPVSFCEGGICGHDCKGSGCPYCWYRQQVCSDCGGRGCPSCDRRQARATY